ncbi:TPA_asm: hypothetical protein G1213_24015 [Salmonella enterica]|nr:hypothetical protein [Salmonella enterica subsp. enterica serovar Anatum]QIN05167.1 hypothetical protein GE197_23410 [Salmonella enterica subsp. enterica serovar Anatum]HAD8375739.1 hypothetical protein [Salmonella enterica]
MGSCAAPSAKGDDKFITTDYLQQCPYLFIFLNTFKYVSAHETITLVNASIILKKEEYEYSTFSCRPYSLFCGILPSCFCSPRNAGESKRC